MGKIVYAVSSIGLGHASRAVAVADELSRRGHVVVFFSGGSSARLLMSNGYKVKAIINYPTPTFISGNMLFPTLWYFRYWLSYKMSKRRVEKTLIKIRPKVVIADEEFACLSVCSEKKIPSIAITDELELGFTSNKIFSRLEQRIKVWYHDLLLKSELIVIPDFGKSTEKVRFVGKIVRKTKMKREQIRMKYGLPLDKKVILVSISGSKATNFLLKYVLKAIKLTNLKDTIIAISGGNGERKDGQIYNLGFVRDNHELVFASDLVISTAGKSTIDEAYTYGTPIIPIPIKGHAEQERNASELNYSFDSLRILPVLILQNINRRSEPHPSRGAEITADLVERYL